MKQTSNYQLNQWEMTDRIQMEDFNRDNEKVDAALAAKLGGVELIQEISITSSFNSYSGPFPIDLSNIDWNQWKIVILLADCKIGGTPDSGDRTYLYSNASTLLFGDLAKRTPGSLCAVFFPRNDGTRPMHVLTFPYGEITSSDSGYNTLTSFNLVYAGTGGQINAGSKVLLLGIR